MICKKCGMANDSPESFCRRCRAELLMPAEGNAEKVKPSSDITLISSRSIFPENIIKGRFKVIDVLGRGGMGEIFLAEDNQSRGKVAIKSIRSALIRDRGAQTRFRSEARTALLLNHPNICTIYEIARENEREYIVMEYVDGVTLDQLQKMKQLTQTQIVDIALQVAEGMIAAQAQHIVHLDIKPGNIMINKSGLVKILDFGLAELRPRKTADRKTRRHEPGLSEPGVVMGSVSYMSPEQVEGQDLDGGSDIFSFGVILVELLTGKNPFSDRNQIVTLYNIQYKEIKLSKDIPKALQKIVRKTLQKARERRYGNFEEIKTDLIAARESMA
ncbi:MAG: serine/threonine-protein kinase [Candidatus Aminicenantes bacterium]|nr:serine/threonine-protein kinase [Candidatus Aminicenantes bacterium]